MNPTAFFIYGPPGSGKTYSLATGPKPTFIFQLDIDGCKTISRVPGIEFEDFVPRDLQKDSLQSISKLKAKLRDMKVRGHSYRMVCCDSLTGLSDLLIAGIITVTGRWANYITPITQGGSGAAMRESDYQTLANQTEEIIRLFLALLDTGCHVVFTSHERISVAELPNGTATVLRLPMLHGQQFPQRVPGLFSELYRAIVKPSVPGRSPEYLWQTQPDYEWSAKSRFTKWNDETQKLEPVLQFYEEPNFSKIIQKVDSAG